ncbi:STAS domain-containing protein [Enterovibrio nigricans]|uniref:Anti-anti-sigma factor n=1 Tax=Enterovibrio nigricans DSM 22720 TaxID=1121868 RepID=A0A1T4UUE1_9GAMM|nr:STAS domain-containing protein [Enterovibrio nigricans]PKF49772.1 anti-sigma factor antagonist [Enterovibrio nigricans]SKA56313.1 anti-anti-sigma factor [Enterovibrio nigricans DSM 22720]
MQIETIKQEDGSQLIRINGDMDSQGCTELQPEFDHLVNNETLQDTTISLAGVDFLDSSGIGAIVFLFKRLKAKGKSLSLIEVHGQPMEIIRLLRIDSAIPVDSAQSTG